VCEERHHGWVAELQGLLCDTEGFVQVGTQIFGSIMGSEGLLEGARRECGECGRVGFDGHSDAKGFGIEHRGR